jgi:hypothetical protein
MIKKIAKQVLPNWLIKILVQEFHKETHINRAISKLEAHTYLEIGIRTGDCFRCIDAPRKIAIDPAHWKFNHELLPNESFFKITSDDFFAYHAEKVLLHQKVDVALIDGLHEFSQALRDILNLEKFMSPKGVIFIHDCNPPTRENTGARDNAPGYHWTGDVWKVAYYIRKYRPDLFFFTLNCDWGLGVLTGFQQPYCSESPSPKILNACNSLDYNVLAKNRKHILQLRRPFYSRRFFHSLKSVTHSEA